MTADELQVGDLVFLDGKVVKIIQLSQTMAVVDGHRCEKLDRLTPIPFETILNSENGLHKKYFNEMPLWMMGCVGLRIVPNRDVEGWDVTVSNKRYTCFSGELFVHDFQHILRMCGLEENASKLSPQVGDN